MTATTIDPDDEALRQLEQRTVMSFTQVASSLRGAQTTRQLRVAADQIQFVPEIGQRNDLGRIYLARASELKSKPLISR